MVLGVTVEYAQRPGEPNTATPTSAARAPERLVSGAGEGGAITQVMKEVCVPGWGEGVFQNAMA